MKQLNQMALDRVIERELDDAIDWAQACGNRLTDRESTIARHITSAVVVRVMRSLGALSEAEAAAARRDAALADSARRQQRQWEARHRA